MERKIGSQRETREAAAITSSHLNNNIAEDDQLGLQRMTPSSSTVPTVLDKASKKSQLEALYNDIQTTAAMVKAIDEDSVDVYLDALIHHISELLELIKEGKKTSQANVVNQYLPTNSEKCLLNLKELFWKGFETLTGHTARRAVKDFLVGIGQAHLPLAGLFILANIIEKFDTLSANKRECLRLIKTMHGLVQLVQKFRKRPQFKSGMADIIKEAIELIAEGSIKCCCQKKSFSLTKFFNSSQNKDDLEKIIQEVDALYKRIPIELVIQIYDANQPGKLPRPYPKYAVGIEDRVNEVIRLLEWDSAENAVAVVLHTFGGMGKTTLADAVFSEFHIERCQYSRVNLFVDIDTPDKVVELQKHILRDLMGSKNIPQIRDHNTGQNELGNVLSRVPALIYIDNVLGKIKLKELLPKDLNKARKVRVLLTTRDRDECSTCAINKMIFYEVERLADPHAKLLLEQKIPKRDAQGQGHPIDPCQMNEIINMCCGVPIVLELVGAFIRAEHDTDRALKMLKENREKMDKPFCEIEQCVFAFDNLPDPCKEPFLDICIFFKGWNWKTVEDIVGFSALDSLEKRSLVTKDTNGVVNVHDVIFRLGREKSKETRFKSCSGRNLDTFLNDKEENEIKKIKGIWLSGNEDHFDVQPIKLDLMHRSLRILKLKNLRKVERRSEMAFKKLIFFQGAVSSLPFNVSDCEELKYLSYQPTDSELFEGLPSGLKHVDFDGSLHSLDFQIYSRDLEQLKNLRILRLTKFEKLKTLPAQLGDVVNGLQELTLSYCKSIEELPQSISNLKYLEELNLQGCINLKELPRSFEKLSSLKKLDLSSCKSLSKLPHSVGYLASLIELSINKCDSLTRLPESIGELKLSSFSMDISCCSSLRELPSRFVKLEYLRDLNLCECRTLETLPQGFGKLRYLEKLNLSKCSALKQLSHDFHCLSSLKILDLTRCERLEELPQNFHCLTSLENLYLSGCESLQKLTEDFHRLPKLRHLYLCSCHNIEGKWMDILVKMEKIQIIIIQGSSLLVNRWGKIQEERNQSWSFAVYTGEDLSKEEKENILQTLLSELDCHLENQEGKPFRISDLSLNTRLLVMFHSDPNDLAWPLIEETIDDTPKDSDFQMIYIGKHFKKFPTKVKNRILGYSHESSELGLMVDKFLLTLDTEVRDSWNRESWLERYNAEKPTYFEMKIVEGGRSSWKVLSDSEMEEFVLNKCDRYTKLKELVKNPQDSNKELLRELFATKGGGKPVFQRKCASKKGRPDSTCGVDEFKGKNILLEMGCGDLCDSIGLSFLAQLYIKEWESKLDLEIISIPTVQSNSEKLPWWVLQSPQTIARTVKHFLVKECGWKGDDIWYPTILCTIESSGRISTCKPFELIMQKMWKPKAYPFTQERFEEYRRKERDQLKSTHLEFIFQCVSDKVKEGMFQGKMICLYNGNRQVTCSIKNALAELSDSVHIIYIPKFSDNLSEIPQIDMEGMSLSEQEVLKFWMWLHYLKEEINGMNLNDQSLLEMRELLHSFEPMEDTWMTFIDEDGKLLVTCRGETMEWIFRDYKEDRAKRLIKKLIKVFKGKIEQTHNVQENVDFNLDILNINYTSELLELVQLEQIFGLNKETRHHWTASEGFSVLKEFPSDGETVNDDLDKNIRCLVEGISEENLAAAGLGLVADILRGFRTVSGYGNEWLTLLEEMNRLAQYIKQLNEQSEEEKYEVMRMVTMWILHSSIMCCAQIEPSKFARFFEGSVNKTKVLELQKWLRRSQEKLRTPPGEFSQTYEVASFLNKNGPKLV